MTALLLAAAGFVAGVLNVLAGGGSFLTLPVLIFAGLPAGVANGTNRVGILAQNVAAVWSFGRDGLVERRWLVWTALPATVGAAAGTGLALRVGDELFQRILALLMIAISLLSLWRREPDPEAAPRPLVLVLAFFFVGIYGGFVQAGVGFLVLAATSSQGFDLVRGNALKVATILCFTLLSLSIFAVSGKVSWVEGGALATGTVFGGWVGARLTVLKGHRWLRRVVTAAIVVFAIRLWWTA